MAIRKGSIVRHKDDPPGFVEGAVMVLDSEIAGVQWYKGTEGNAFMSPDYLVEIRTPEEDEALWQKKIREGR
jgi:hypothetical protein